MMGMKNAAEAMGIDTDNYKMTEEDKKFKEKYQRVIDILEKNYNFNKTLEKRIWSLGTLSNMKAMDILFKK